MPVLVAQSDVCLTGDQEVAGLIPAGSGNILSWQLNMKYFSVVILSLLLIRGNCQFLVKECAQILVKSLENYKATE